MHLLFQISSSFYVNFMYVIYTSLYFLKHVVSCKKVFLKIRQIYGEKSVSRVSFFDNVASWELKSCNFKNETPAHVFSCEFCEIVNVNLSYLAHFLAQT